MPSTPDSIPEPPLPEYLKAITELTREAEGSSLRRFLRDYAHVLVVLIAYGVAASLNATGLSSAHFLGVIAIVLMLQEVTERRAQRRLRLIHEVLLQLMHRTRTGASD